MREIQHEGDFKSRAFRHPVAGNIQHVAAYNVDMKGQILRRLRREKDLTLERLAELAGTSNQQLSKLENGKAKITLDWAVRLARAMDVDPALFNDLAADAAVPSVIRGNGVGVPRGNPLASPAPQDRSLPVMGRAEGGGGIMRVAVDERPVDWTFRPPQLEHVKSAYAIILSGQSMEPAYDEGDVLWVNPDVGTPIGQDALIIMMDDRAFVKRIVKRTETFLVVRQFGEEPGELPPIPMKDIRAIHRVVGSWNR